MGEVNAFGQWNYGWQFFGSELKYVREENGLSQTELGSQIYVSGSYIGQFENANRKPQVEVAQRIDRHFRTNGIFERMCNELINNTPFADHFAVASKLEATAQSICEYSPQLIPGLLQTPEYARAIFRAGRPLQSEDEINVMVAARMARARILTDPDLATRPVFWVILDEAVLRRPVGGPAAMGEQLRHVARFAEEGRIIVQVLPFTSGPHALCEGSLRLMTFADAPPVAYTEGPFSGQLIDDQPMVAQCEMAYDLLRAAALPREASLVLIESIAEEYAHEH